MSNYDDYGGPAPTWQEALKWDIENERYRLLAAKNRALRVADTRTDAEREEAMDAAMNASERPLTAEEEEVLLDAWQREDESLEPLLRKFELEWRNRVIQHPSDPRHCECGDCHILRRDLLTNGPFRPWLVWLQNTGLWEGR